MEYIFLVVSLISLIIFYPIYYNFYTEDTLKCQIILYGIIRVNINLSQFAKYFSTRKKGTDDKEEENDFNITELVENFKKLKSTQPYIHDLTSKANVKHFYWYTALPMENILGLAILPIYSTAQGIVQDALYDNFNHVKDVDIDTKYNYVDNDIFIYLDCIIQTNLGKIIIVSLKYIRKIPLLLKRVT